MAAVTHDLKNKKGFWWPELWRKHLQEYSLSKGNIWHEEQEKASLVHYKFPLSLSLCFSAPKRRRSDGSRRHTGTAGLIWLISLRTTSNQAPHPVSLTPVAPWDTSIYTLTQHCNSPKCLHQPNCWSSGRLWFRVTKAVRIHMKKKTWLMWNDDQLLLVSLRSDVWLQQQQII